MTGHKDAVGEYDGTLRLLCVHVFLGDFILAPRVTEHVRLGWEFTALTTRHIALAYSI